MSNLQRLSRSFKDISLSFEPHPVTKDIPILKNETAILRSVKNLVETLPGERFFNSLIGSDVRSSLFDFVDYATASVIQKEIEVVISNYEPRISDLNVEVTPFPDTNEFEVNLSFNIIGQSFPLQQFTFILEATR
jgi:phage baseplate assembly protein W